MKHLWGGVVGERLWSWLRGQETPLAPTHRHSMGHSHVLPPELRHASGVYRVAKRLTGRASVRLRKENFWTTGMILAVRFTDKTGWEGKARFAEAQDTPRLLKVLDELWSGVPPREPLWVAVTLVPLVAENRHTPSLFDNPKQETLSRVMDTINMKYGKEAAYFASLHDSLRQAPMRISFSRIPNLAEF